jgi:hypothetical protein
MKNQAETTKTFTAPALITTIIIIIIAIAIVTLILIHTTNKDDGPVSPISPLPIESVAEGKAYVMWDDPALEQGYAVFTYTNEAEAPDWRLYHDLELRQNGKVIASQTVDTDAAAATERGSGIFATLEWNWPDFPGQAEEWARVRWSAPDESDVYGYTVLDDGTLAERYEDGFSLARIVTGKHRIYLPIISIPD